MSWDDQERKEDPWKNNRGNEPEDLDAVIRDLQKKFSKFFGGKKFNNGSRRPGKLNGFLSGIIMVILAVWGFSGFYQISDAERGVVFRFGQFTNISQPGLRWHLPWPIESVETINTNATERLAYQGSMLTKDENIVDVDIEVQYRRENPQDFLFNLRSPESTLRDITGSAIREVVGKNELDFILTEGRAEISIQALELVQSTLDLYGAGITIFELNLQEANFPSDVEASVQDAIKAREDKERMSFEAEAYANDILPNARGSAARELLDAEGYKARVIADAEGEASRFTQILREYEQAEEVTRQRMYLETIENVLANSTKVLLDAEGGGNLIYLPLDRLMERRDDSQQPMSPLMSNPVASDSSLPSRSRDLR
ncbi:MAG: HflK protein [Gammaproteobacteria bacterium TMED78]|nr:MAG: HflK protein [Gammaproteobacteria bacterium TMED78]|tara:strand:- start:31364 stop:32476 length:1113 start_codon:yes stop_codon:yes gene_type:complete